MRDNLVTREILDIVFVSFCYCNKILGDNQLRGRKGLLWLTSSEISSHVQLLHCLGLVVRQSIVFGSASWRSCLPHGGQEMQRARKGPPSQYLILPLRVLDAHLELGINHGPLL